VNHVGDDAPFRIAVTARLLGVFQRALILLLVMAGLLVSARADASASSLGTAFVLETRVGVTTHLSGRSSARLATESPACVGENRPVYGGSVLVSCVATKPSPCSFGGETRVLMADGTTKPISLVKVGDMVLAHSENCARTLTLRSGRPLVAVD
jgi:hypothetical protein